MTISTVALIARKRDGQELSAAEIAALVSGFTRCEIPDYQMTALLMAIYLRGLSDEETAALTQAMLQSGLTMAWPAGAPPVVDKHSTGGVGDKISLVLAPLLACCDLWVPMISGRGLGATGGTLDKLESIPGFRTDLSTDEIRAATMRVGAVISGATADIAPADKMLYALRDVTATVASPGLITASIMSKKLAEGLDALVLDVKFGSGAFMKTRERADELARSLVATGARVGVKTSALLTDMNQPLGRMIGNAVEVDEAVAALRGEGPPDLVELTLALGAELLLAAGRAASLEQATTALQQHLDAGRGLEKFAEMVAAQGGDLAAPRAVAAAGDLVADEAGYLTVVDTEQLGQAVILLGGGRRVMSDRIDHSVGLEMLIRSGDPVDRGQPLLRIFAPPDKRHRCHDLLRAAIRISPQPPAARNLIADRMRG